MKSVILYAIVICIVLFISLIVAIIILAKRANSYSRLVVATREQADELILQTKSEAEIQIKHAIDEEHQKAVQAIRMITENIEARREILAKQTDKELLINIIMALDGVSSRLNRLEGGLEAASQNLSNIQDKTMAIQNTLSEHAEKMHNTLSEIGAKLVCDDSEYGSIGYAINEIYDKINDSSSMYDIDAKLDDIKSELYWVKSAAEDAKNAIECI